MTRSKKRLGRSGRSGFTLIELLAVIVLIAMLLGIAITAAQMAFRAARSKRYSLTCRILEAAIYRYHHEYRDWPIPKSGSGLDQKYRNKSKDKEKEYEYIFSGQDNKESLSMLRVSAPQNRKKISFLDESGLLAERGGKVVSMATAGEGTVPFVYRDRANKMKYYSVTIDIESEKVTIK